ncbi:MAG: hypothetical protein ACR2JH_01000 [Solirubrobacteraceae bacterium]
MRLLAGIEHTDEDIAAANDGDQVDVAVIDGATWHEIVGRRLEVELLEAIELVPVSDGYAAAAAFMRAHKLVEPIRPPPRE